MIYIIFDFHFRVVKGAVLNICLKKGDEDVEHPWSSALVSYQM